MTIKKIAKSKRARKSGQGSKWIRKDKRLAIYLRDGMACAYCGVGLECGKPLSLDHLLPNSKGGSNDQGNLITCCLKCNSERGDMDLDLWIDKALGERGESTARFIMEHIALDLKPYRIEAKAIIARRQATK